MGTFSNGVTYYDYHKVERRSGHNSELKEETIIYSFA